MYSFDVRGIHQSETFLCCGGEEMARMPFTNTGQSRHGSTEMPSSLCQLQPKELQLNKRWKRTRKNKGKPNGGPFPSPCGSASNPKPNSESHRTQSSLACPPTPQMERNETGGGVHSRVVPNPSASSSSVGVSGVSDQSRARGRRRGGYSRGKVTVPSGLKKAVTLLDASRLIAGQECRPAPIWMSDTPPVSLTAVSPSDTAIL